MIAGLVGAAFFASLELGQRLLLGQLAGFEPLRARGETFLGPEPAGTLRPLVLVVLPALGGLASGLLTHWLAPGRPAVVATRRSRRITTAASSGDASFP